MKTRAFSIAELVVSLGILVVMMAFMMANFHSGQQANELRNGADLAVSQVRAVQTAALAGRLVSVCNGGAQANQVCEAGKLPYVGCSGGGVCQGRGVPGYGIRFQVNQATYTLFYDVNGNYRYDAGEEAVSKPFVQSGTVKLTAANVGLPLDIVFVAPNAKPKFNGADAPDILTFTLQQTATAATRIISVYRISGKVEHN